MHVYFLLKHDVTRLQLWTNCWLRSIWDYVAQLLSHGHLVRNRSSRGKKVVYSIPEESYISGASSIQASLKRKFKKPYECTPNYFLFFVVVVFTITDIFQTMEIRSHLFMIYLILIFMYYCSLRRLRATEVHLKHCWFHFSS